MNAAITGSLACCDTVAKGTVAHARTQVIAWLADLGIGSHHQLSGQPRVTNDMCVIQHQRRLLLWKF